MELTDYLRFILALALVVGLILAMSWGLKRFGVGNFNRALTTKRRLRTVESASIDSRHKVVLVRRDAVEHLVLVGPGTAQVIETGIPANPDNDAGTPALSDTFRSVLQSATGTKT